MTNRNSSNNLLVPGVESALNKMKLEIAQEFGFSDYDSIDKGNLTARQNGKIGGEMTKRLIELGQKQLLNEASNSTITQMDFVEENQSFIQ